MEERGSVICFTATCKIPFGRAIANARLLVEIDNAMD